MNIDNVINYLKSYNNKDIKLMEICGTHTASIAENAIQSIISDKIRSGMPRLRNGFIIC